MNCSDCRYFYTERYNHYTGYCKQIDRYDSMQLLRCPFEKKLSGKDKMMLKLMKLFRIDKKLECSNF